MASISYKSEVLPALQLVEQVHNLLTPDQQIIIPISELTGIFYDSNFRFCVNEDRKSGTFNKVPLQLLESRTNDFGAWACRIDPLKYFTQSFNEFQVVKQTEINKLKKCALVSITAGFEKLRTIIGDKEMRQPGISFPGSKNSLESKWISEDDAWMTQIARFGGTVADMYDFRKVLGEKAGIPVNAGGAWFYDFNSELDKLTAFGNLGGPGYPNPGMLAFCQPGILTLDETYRKQFVRGRMVVVYKISMKDERPDGAWGDEVFVFTGELVKDDTGVSHCIRLLLTFTP